MLGFAMASDDWLKLGIAAIATIQVIAMALIGLGSAWLKWKLDKGEKLVNGRMDQIVREVAARAFSEGHSVGVAATARAVGDSPRVAAGEKELANAVADSLLAPSKAKP